MKMLCSIVGFAMVSFSANLWAEVPLLSSEELSGDATHVVVGKVRSVYSTTTKTEHWQDTKSVAEIAVLSVEKGSAIASGDVLHAHYWNKRWIGKGDPDPHSAGHAGVAKGDFVRAYLTRNDGVYQVLLPNGLAKLQAEEVKESSGGPASNLQGTWDFVYYEEQGAAEQPGTKQFIITDDTLDFRAGGQTRVETRLQLDAGQNPKHFTQRFKDGQVYRSIYVLAGDYLVLCGIRDGGRPADFSCDSDNGGDFLIVLKRVHQSD